MTSTPLTPDARRTPAPNRHAILIATGFGLGRVPKAPGTAGSLGAAVVFAPLFFGLENPLWQFVYFLALMGLALVALWSTEAALPHWTSADPQAVVIDEILGQWLTYGGLVLAVVLGRSLGPTHAGWKYLLAGFILFRVFDVLKPFPIRRSEQFPGAAGVLLDDVLAAVYAGAGLMALVWSGWLT
ncbi:MAG: phosphatidylglycerophosphatase A family protein [Candidatus Acidiferrales bacterium]